MSDYWLGLTLSLSHKAWRVKPKVNNNNMNNNNIYDLFQL